MWENKDKRLELISFFVIAAKSFKLCPRNTPDMAKCVSDSINLLRPALKTGDFGNGFFVDALDPIKLDDIVIDRGEGFYVNLNNLKATGASNFKITKFRINLEHFRVDAIIEVPKVEAHGLYRLKMLLGVLNLEGQGNVRAHLGKKAFGTLECSENCKIFKTQI